MTSQRGKFITIEGQDGAGKSTNVSVVKAWLAEQGIDFEHSREPGGTQFGETIRELILNSSNSQSSVSKFGDKAELLLLFAARAQHIEEVIEPALASGKWLLCDRFTDATYAYQGGGRGLSWDEIAQLEQAVQGDLRPDLTILLDLPVELGESRTGNRNKGFAPDRFEQQKLDFKQRVRDAYLKIACNEPDRLRVVDASASLNDVEEQIQNSLNEFLASNR